MSVKDMILFKISTIGKYARPKLNSYTHDVHSLVPDPGLDHILHPPSLNTKTPNCSIIKEFDSGSN